MPFRHFELPAHFQPPQARTLDDADEALEEYTFLYKASERIDIGDTNDWDQLLRIACKGEGDHWSEAIAWRLLASIEKTPNAGRDMIERALDALCQVDTELVEIDKLVRELRLLRPICYCFRKRKAVELKQEDAITGMLADLTILKEEAEAAAAGEMYVEDDEDMDVDMDVDTESSESAEGGEEHYLAAGLEDCRLEDEMEE